MDSQIALALLQAVREARQKQAGAEEFAANVQNAASDQLRGQALGDVRNIGLAGLGVGALGAGAVGLLNLIKRNRTRKTKSGPALLPLPYPVEPSDAPSKMKLAGFMGGDSASTVGGIPWYTPAMFAAGLGGVGLGWKGVDALMNQRRKKESGGELDAARQEFHDALLAQYDEPLKTHPSLIVKKGEEKTTMEKVGEALDDLWEKTQNLVANTLNKEAVDWGNLGGQALGGYGAYAGLSGLLAGALVYDKVQKRSRRAVIEKALQKRQRREFMSRPTEIYATPEPMLHTPEIGQRAQQKLLKSPEEDVPSLEV